MPRARGGAPVVQTWGRALYEQDDERDGTGFLILTLLGLAGCEVFITNGFAGDGVNVSARWPDQAVAVERHGSVADVACEVAREALRRKPRNIRATMLH